MTMCEVKMRLLVHEASRWEGIKEVGGDNRGQVVEMFQKAVDGKANAEAWCAAYIQFCIKQVDAAYDVFMDRCMPRATLFPTEHCMTMWRMTPREQRTEAKPGAIVLWQFFKDGTPTANGHCGIITAITGDNRLKTLEGNSANTNSIERNGGEVVAKDRSMTGDATMRVLGFLSPWEVEI